jgi:hypothetical protein
VGPKKKEKKIEQWVFMKKKLEVTIFKQGVPKGLEN